MNGVYLLLGSNLGDRLNHFRNTIQLLAERGVRVLDESSIYETAPWGEENQQWFLNMVIQIETASDASELLTTCLEVESVLGRERKEKWGARIIDIDILYYNDEIIDQQGLTIPHPGIHDRRFTLIPLCELCPDELHPVVKESQVQLLANCRDTLDCRLTELQL